MNISRHNRLRVDLGRLINNETQSDIKFIIGEDEAIRYGHSAILSARCPYFAAALQAHWKETSEGVFRKPNIEPEVFDIILQYLYTGEVKVPWNLLTQLIEAALELQLGDLVSGCEEYASQAITEETVFQIIAMSFRHDLSELQSKVLEFFDENARSLVEIDDLFTLDQDALVMILSRDTVELDELEVWETIVRYAYHRNGHDHEGCPLLQFPYPPGRIVVKVSKVDEVDLQEPPAMVGSRAYSADESSFLDYGLGDTLIGSKDVVVVLRQDHFQNLRATVQPLLPAIRLVNLEAADFARCIEGTGLIPADLCRRMYRYYALPIGHPEYFPSPRRPRSKLLPHRQWLTLLSWIAEAAIMPGASNNPSRQ
ncbi:BTB/POZ domain-containing protein 9, partial [Actinomortierella ambigua]